MSCFTLPVLLLLVFFSSAHAAPLYPVQDEALLKAAERLREKDYKKALEAAQTASECGIKQFMLGMSSHRLERWDEAADHLGKAADSFPLLSDYALYYRGDALFRLNRFADAVDPIRRLLKERQESPFARSAQMLYADILFNRKDFQGALEAYQSFIEKYSSGADAVRAAYQSALCREAGGDKEKAAQALRNIWLTYPDRPVSRMAGEELASLASAGVHTPPYSPDELLKRGVTLYNLGKFEQAINAFKAINTDGTVAEFQTRLKFRTGQALCKARRYREAQQLFAALQEQDVDKELRLDIQSWLARTLYRSGREDEAFALYIKIADAAPGAELSQDALLQAAYIKRFQSRPAEAVPLLERLVKSAPGPKVKARGIWEMAWNRYIAKEYAGAGEAFRQLLNNDAYRERALYWYGQSLLAKGDKEGAQSQFAALKDGFPTGFYALRARSNNPINDPRQPLPYSDPVSALPLPAGYERVKALITLGLLDEARRELGYAKKKGAKQKTLLGIARLYLEMGDYNASLHLVGEGALGRLRRNDPIILALNYPKAYKDLVAAESGKNKISQGLVYSLIRAESQFSPTALSPVGAVGLMQIMPATAKAVSKKKGRFDTAGLTSPAVNIRLGVRHLKDLLNLYNGNIVSTVASYNAGCTAVDRWRKNFSGLREDEFIENIPYPETREYVKKVLTVTDLYNRFYNLDKPLAPKPEGIEAPQEPQTSSSTPPETDTQEDGPD